MDTQFNMGEKEFYKKNQNGHSVQVGGFSKHLKKPQYDYENIF
jgi:hypothetical protein